MQEAPLKPWETATEGWTIKHWIDFEAGEQKRRAKPIDNETADVELKRGEQGFLHHYRRGLLGAVQSWAQGCKKAVIHIVMAVIGDQHGFGIESEVRERLAGSALKQAATDAYIVDRLAGAVDVFKKCATEEARQSLHIVLGAVAPEVVTGHAARRTGMARAVWGRLRVRRGRRMRTKEQEAAGELGRPFASMQATLKRQVFDAKVKAAKEPLQVWATCLRPCPCPCLCTCTYACTCTCSCPRPCPTPAGGRRSSSQGPGGRANRLGWRGLHR